MSHNHQKKPVIAVVGAGPGIGEAVARRFVSSGFVAALLARTEGKLQAMVSGITSSFGPETARHYLTDLRIESQVQSSFNLIHSELGAASVLIYNAALDE
jgi:NADP-dependent 3-hydroxy acid dehydrogenase YdfG